MRRIWFIADTHFGDAKILQQRQKYRSIAEHDRDLAERWNAFVQPHDIVYCIGDIGNPTDGTISQLHGIKHLLIGNHEEEGYTCQGEQVQNLQMLQRLQREYNSVRAYNSVYDRYMCSHLPLNQATIYDGYLNVHGHIHDKRVDSMLNAQQISPLHFNVGADVNGLAPVSIEQLDQAWDQVYNRS